MRLRSQSEDGSKNMVVAIDGASIDSEARFHEVLGSLLGFGAAYGRNLDALWDRLSADVPRPITLVWKSSSMSRQRLGARFHDIIAVLHRVKAQDEEWGLTERFSFRLE